MKYTHVLYATDLQMHVNPIGLASDYGLALRHAINADDEWFTIMHGEHLGEQGLLLNPTLLRPKSRGRLTLGGGSIHDSPVIDTNFLSHPDDLRTLVEGLKLVERVEQTDEFRKR